MMMGCMMLTLAEGLTLGERMGLNNAELLDVIGASALANPLFANKGPRMLAGDFEPQFPLKVSPRHLF